MTFALRVQTPALRILNSPSTYPLSTFWLGAMAVLLSTSEGWINLSTGFVTLAFLALLLIMAAFRKDIAVVHGLVNSQHDDLVDRVQQLTDALLSSGTEVPKPPSKGSVT